MAAEAPRSTGMVAQTWVSPTSAGTPQGSLSSQEGLGWPGGGPGGSESLPPQTWFSGHCPPGSSQPRWLLWALVTEGLFQSQKNKPLTQRPLCR